VSSSRFVRFILDTNCQACFTILGAMLVFRALSGTAALTAHVQRNYDFIAM